MYTNHKFSNSPINYALTAGLLLIGVGVFLFSLYVASLSGLMSKLGLVGGDLRQELDTNKLYRGLMEVGGIPNCDWWETTKTIPEYIFTPKNKRIKLGLEVGKKRRNCAINYVLNGNVERGVYTMLKGVRYERLNLLELERGVLRDKTKCIEYNPRDYGDIEVFIESSRGNVRSVIYKEYEEISQIRSRLEESCGTQLTQESDRF